ncbi:hypothetical protein [Paenibacillus sp. NEAU-GSW1]|uniref:hypothetical protein n=1 Tax=Paenibacillus sp. NEAU-GSW1 TaxID=2682486 RepID=UPI00139E0554|nr:hypothetical protein [Paenibacillus sp. NEAU-GSW1]
MDKKIRRYYQLKQKQKELEEELGGLRSEIIQHCSEQGVSELESGSYRVKIVAQERKEFDEGKLYEALPDPRVWRLASKADAGKIAGLIKLNVITEETIKDTFSTRSVSVLIVDKK